VWESIHDDVVYPSISNESLRELLRLEAAWAAARSHVEQLAVSDEDVDLLSHGDADDSIW